ncbi:MAG: M48 family metalloprotease [Candidatus Eremiobacteraeota bacterium]|nr:M48 family metalloprotease [Candidatus Eremiobacteraeota bacterium]
MKHSLKILVLVMILLLSGAAAPCRADVSESQEISIGQAAASKLEAQYGVWSDPTQYERINRIGSYLLPVNERRNLRFTFKILNTQELNAISLPGGFIYVTRGLLPVVDDHELAFVLGHEMAHVAKKHALQQVDRQMTTNMGISTILILLSKGQVSQQNQTAAQILSLIVNSKYSREDEFEADLVSCVYMVYGPEWDPNAGVTFMRKLKKQGGGELPGFVNSLVGSHPLDEERIKAIEEECRKLGY